MVVEPHLLIQLQVAGVLWFSLVSLPVFLVQNVEGVEDGEARITVIETSTGEKLTGEDAPKKAELEEWLKEHPGYEVLEDNDENSESEVILYIILILLPW